MASTDSRPLPLKSTAFRLYFTAYDSSGVPVTGFTSPDSELSKDGGAFADATNEATYVGHGQGYIDLTAAEMAYDHVGFYFSCSEGSTRDCISICPTQDAAIPANVTHSGTAQAGGATSITLASGASATNAYYYHQLVQIVSGTGAGQVRQIIGYIGSTKVASVNYAWQTNPDNTSVYRLLADHVPFCDAGGVTWAYNHAGSAIATITATNALATLIGTPAGADVSTDIAAIKGETASILADTGTDGVLISIGTAAGQLSVTTGVVLARDHEGDEIAKATNLATLISRVGSFTATGANTVLGMFKALLSKVATLPSDVGGTFDPATDSTEAIRDRGDAAWTTGTTPPTAAAIADAVLDEAVSDHTTAGTTGAQLASIYAAQIDFADDEDNSKDEYSVQWFKNGAPVTSGITSPTIQVIKRADGTDLVASSAMTQIGSTGAYKYDETTNRVTSGEAVLVQVQATIDGSARTWRKLVSRDTA